MRHVISECFVSNSPQHLLNGYGPTETTIFATTYEMMLSRRISGTSSDRAADCEHADIRTG